MTELLALLMWCAVSLSLTTCGAHVGDNDDTRGSPRSAKQIEFTSQLVLTTPGSKPRVMDPKQDHVASGDTIEIFITPDEKAFVYLGYCDHNDFKLYPEAGHVLLAEAGHRFKIPEPYDIDDDRVLYVIASRAEVSLASPELFFAIAHSRQAMDRGAMDSDCAGGPGKGTGSQEPSVIPIDRAPVAAIKAVRYELLRRPQPAARR
jgi:hypothetical protein